MLLQWQIIKPKYIHISHLAVMSSTKGVRKGGGWVWGYPAPPLSLICYKNFATFARRLIVFTHVCLLICRLNVNATE